MIGLIFALLLAAQDPQWNCENPLAQQEMNYCAARDAERAFYPLTEWLTRHLCDEPDRTLAALHEDLLDHVGGRLHDDAALLLLRRPAAVQPGEAAGVRPVVDVDGATAA